MPRDTAKCRQLYDPWILEATNIEFILPDIRAPLYPSLLDINMMALLSRMERTEKQWKTLLNSVGLEILKFHRDDESTEGLIEAVLSLNG